MAALFIYSVFIFGLTTLLVGAEIRRFEFDQYEIDAKSGIVFEDLGSVQLYHAEWTFVTYVNLSYFATETTYLEQTVQKIHEFCEKISAEFALALPSSYCETSLPPLDASLEQIREYSTKWFTTDTSRYENELNVFRRRKRGFLGSITKRLFGTLSEDEGSYYMQQINSLKTENYEHMLLTEKQTTLLEDQLKVLNHTVRAQNIQRAALQAHFDDVSFVLKNATTEAAMAQASSVLVGKLTEFMQYTSYLIIGIREKQRYMFEAITTKSKTFQLIPPRVFMEELERIRSVIARNDLSLPLPLNNENLSKFYQITTSNGRIVDNNLVVRFSVPLIENKRFTLFKAFSAPHRNSTNETFSYIVPRYEYIAIDSTKEKFIELTADTLTHHCHRVDEKNRICKQTFPVMTANNHSGCEINVLLTQNVSSSCDFRTSSFSDERWVQMHQANTYLYTLPNSVQAVVLCDQSRTVVNLQNTGVISMDDTCRIKTDRIEIAAHRSINKMLQQTFAETKHKLNINATAEMEKVKQIQQPKIPYIKLPHLLNEDSIIIRRLSKNLNELTVRNEIGKEAAGSLLKTGFMSSTNSIPQILLAVAIIALAIAVVYTCIRRSILQGRSIIVFVVLVIIATLTVLYFI